MRPGPYVAWNSTATTPLSRTVTGGQFRGLLVTSIQKIVISGLDKRVQFNYEFLRSFAVLASVPSIQVHR